MTISFLHSGNETWASYRYRAQRPAAYLGAAINDPFAEVLIFSKPVLADVAVALSAHGNGRRVIVDYCDDHFDRIEYRQLAELADAITAATPEMARRVLAACPNALRPTVIADPYEYEEVAPHVTGRGRILWFGHPSNVTELRRIPSSMYARLDVVSTGLETAPGLPAVYTWSPSVMRQAFARADLVVLPEAKPWKSANRAIEAIRQGCFVLAEPHPSRTSAANLGSYVGDLAEGLAWIEQQSPADLNAMIAAAQRAIRPLFSIETIGEQWRAVIDHVRQRATPLPTAAGIH